MFKRASLVFFLVILVLAYSFMACATEHYFTHSRRHELPDTGQGSTYGSSDPGEDGDYQPTDTQLSFTDNGDGTITDNVTGLMWAKDGNGSGCNSGGTLNWQNSIDFCYDLSFAGYADWRLPNAKEAQSIIDYSIDSPCLSATYFPNTKSSDYWTSTTSVSASLFKWKFGATYGGFTVALRSGTNYARCVRGGPD